jgi:kinesin family member 5
MSVSLSLSRSLCLFRCRHIFRHINSDREGTEFTIKCSFLEIYKEVINDLLDVTNKNLKVRETPSKGVWIDGLTEQFVSCEEDVFDLIRAGEKNRYAACCCLCCR